MGRRTSGGTVGQEKIGNISATGATLATTQTNQDLTIDPNGTGAVNVTADTIITGDLTIANQGDLRLREASGNGTNYIAQQAAATMATNYTITWPAAVSGTSGFVLSSDTSGNLSWTSAGGNIPVTDSGSTATVHYPFFGTASGSLPTTLTPLVRSNLSFVPSTGILTATGFAGPLTGNVTGNVSGSAGSATGNAGSASTIAITTTDSSATTHYLTFNTTSGVASTQYNSSKMTFVPSTGTLTSTIVTASSDARLKENVRPISGALDLVLQLAGVMFNRIGQTNDEIGYLAQKVEQILPQVVHTDDQGFKSVAYGNVVALLSEAIKEQQLQIEELKGRLA
jgi:hypothetical protein